VGGNTGRGNNTTLISGSTAFLPATLVQNTGTTLTLGDGTTTGVGVGTLNATNVNGKLGIVGASTASGNVVLCNNTSNTSGNFDLQTDSDQHLTFSGGTGPGSNVLSVGGATNGGITVPSTAGSITVNTARLSTGAGNLGGNIVLGSSTSGTNLTGAGLNNTIIGTDAGNALTSGNINTYVGYICGDANTTGAGNTAIGAGAGGAITTGSNNICIGRDAGFNITTGSQNICLGYNNQTSAIGTNNEIVIGNNITGAGANHILMRAVEQVFIQSGGAFYGVNLGNSGAPVLVSIYDSSTYYFMDFGKRTTSYTNPPIFNLYRADQTNCAGMYMNNSVPLQFVISYGSQTTTGTTWAFINGTGATNWDFPSDARLKNSIVDLPSQTEKLMKLRPVNYKFNSTPNQLKYGFIAQDVKEVYPEFISIMPKQNPEDEDYYGMGLPDFVPCLVKVAQDQQTKINSLEAQLASLKAVVDALVAQKDLLVV
jgi:hypothetical protein